MGAPNYTDTMTVGAHTDTTAITNDSNADWPTWLMLPGLLVNGFVASYALQLLEGAELIVKVAVLAALAVAVGLGVWWPSYAWWGRRNPERYAACKATLAAARERRRAKLRRRWPMSSARRAASERP